MTKHYIYTPYIFYIECLPFKNSKLSLLPSSLTSSSLLTSLSLSALSKALKLLVLVHSTKRMHYSFFIHTDKGLANCLQAPPPCIFSCLTSWTNCQRMIPFSRVISFLSEVLGSRRLAIVDDLGLPQECLRWYDTKSPRHSKLFVNFNMATSLWSKCGVVFTCSVLPALSMDSLSFSSWLPTLT
jgi:hypothetical protein